MFNLSGKRSAWAMRIFIILLLASLYWPVGHLPFDHSKVLLSAKGEPLRIYLTKDEKKRVEVKQLPTRISDSLLCLEDQRFYWHPGVDPLALSRAIFQNIVNQRVVSGASTITMQLARLLSRKKRTLLSKISEAHLALRIEAQYSKDEIIKMYLEKAPFGYNIEGIESASFSYYGKEPKQLSWNELTMLMMLPQSPHRWLKLDSQKLLRRRNFLLKRLSDCGLIKQKQVAKSTNEPLVRWQKSQKTYAHHLADYLFERNPQGTRIQSTIRLDIQSAVEKYMAEQYRKFTSQGVQNTSILVIENSTASLVGAVGNFAYKNLNGQMISSFSAFRSPGSTLKPFLFSYLVNNGWVLPETLIEDVPTEYPGYTPKNFDGEFRGLVTAEMALSESLNVPFVNWLERVGVDPFLEFLKSAGFRHAEQRAHLGLSLIVGGIEVNAFDLAGLYLALASKGVYRPIRTNDQSKLSKGFQWIQPGTAYLTNRVLAKRSRPDFPTDKDWLYRSNGIRWKTGTSQGRRDAWSVGFNERYTVVVWLGNLNYQPSPALVGAKSAAPVLFDLFQALAKANEYHVAGNPEWYGLQEVEVCAYSGRPATSACPHRKKVFALRSPEIGGFCSFHQSVLVESTTGYRVNRSCVKQSEARFKTFLKFPQRIRKWIERDSINVQMVPPFASKCIQRKVLAKSLPMVSPEAGRTYYMNLSQKGLARVPMRLPGEDLSEVTCLLNGRQIQWSEHFGLPHLNVQEGHHRLYCSDKVGRSKSVSFRVKRI